MVLLLLSRKKTKTGKLSDNLFLGFEVGRIMASQSAGVLIPGTYKGYRGIKVADGIKVAHQPALKWKYPSLSRWAQCNHKEVSYFHFQINGRDGGQGWKNQSQSSEDVTLLVLKMKERAMSQRMQVASGSHKRLGEEKECNPANIMILGLPASKTLR
uniref:Uncharacterized protein n=1 Tax=Pipistrellus kuhlii TaxID=59472 RepID=A0A7J7YXC3_PIPKU|nr:hypothetical protein mPipKuh1_009862 [Pipistrellus kuhlii]